jgi:hypothetical protein
MRASVAPRRCDRYGVESWEAGLMKRRIVLASMLAAVVPALALAQEGRNYDPANRITISGPIVMSRYENPDATIRVQTPAKAWTVVLAPIARMGNRGASRDLVAIGRMVIVEGYASTTEADEMRAERITVDGKMFELR